MPVSSRIIKCLLLGIVIHFAESMHFQRHTCYLIHHILFSVNRCHENTCYACSSQEWCSPWSPMRRFMPKLMASVLTISFLPSAFGAISSTTFLGIEISTWTNCLINKLEVCFFPQCWTFQYVFSAHVDFPDVIFSWSSEAEENKFTKTPPDAEQPRSFVQRLGTTTMGFNGVDPTGWRLSGIIKSPIWEGSNNANVWWFWRICP